jgi:hypothetical protein
MTPKDELKNFSHVDLLFPSRYVKAADLRGASVTVYIERIVPREKLMMAGGKSDQKPVIYLKGKEKGWILNKTNARDIAKAWGNETTEWLGKPVVIVSKQVEARGETVDAIRIDLPATLKLARGGKPAQQREPGWDDLAPGDDEQQLANAARAAEQE